jgi:hypothetical protein
MANAKVFNVVCLHGFTQNADIMYKKLTGLVKPCTKIHCHYLEGTIVLPPTPDADIKSKTYGIDDFTQRGWWISNPADPHNMTWDDIQNPAITLHGLDETLKRIIDFGKTIGGIDGLIGFSQGGCVVDYLCKMHSIGLFPFNLKFAIMISAMRFRRIDLIPSPVDLPLSIPSLHYYGLTDTVIPHTESELLADTYINPIKSPHEKNHIVPTNSISKKFLRDFVDKI